MGNLDFSDKVKLFFILLALFILPPISVVILHEIVGIEPRVSISKEISKEVSKECAKSVKKENTTNSKEENFQTVNIKSVKLENAKNAAFILGFGSIEDKDYYVVYEEQEDGGYKLGKLPIEKTTIYYLDNGQNPYYTLTKNTVDFSLEVKLYIPSDTIQENYNLNNISK